MSKTVSLRWQLCLLILCLTLRSGWAQQSPSFETDEQLAQWNQFVELTNAGIKALNARQYDEAQQQLAAAVKQAEQVVPESKHLAMAYGSLATCLMRAKKYAPARQAYAKQLAVSQKVFGPDSVQVAQSAMMSGYLSVLLKDYPAAEKGYQQVLAVAEAGGQLPANVKLGSVLKDLATVYTLQNKHEQAQQVYEKAYPMLEKTLGPGDPQVAAIASRLASSYRKQKEYDKAAVLLEKILAARRQAVGADQVTEDMADLLQSLASVNAARGKYPQADKQLAEAVKIYRATTGPTSAATAKAMYYHARVMLDMNQRLRAAREYEQAVPVLTKALGPVSAELENSLMQLVLAGQWQDQPAQSLPWMEQLLALRQKKLQPTDPMLAKTYAQLGRLQSQVGEHAKARKALDTAAQMYAKASGDHQLEQAMMLNELGLMSLDAQKPKEAQAYFEQSLKQLAGLKSADELVTALVINNLATAMLEQGRGGAFKARKELLRAMQLVEQAKGTDHIQLAGLYENYARALGGRSRVAKDYAKKAEVLRKKYGQPSVTFFGVKGY